MILKKESFKFSGHDTFHCREQWILKGLEVVVNQGGTDVFRRSEAIFLLGVGKNMVRSIYHWLKAFGMLDEENNISDIASLLFINDRLDPYLEKEGSLWLLQYFLCSSNYSSIFKLIFSEYFSDKATLEFSEYQILNFLNREIANKEQKEVSAKTLSSDFKTFLRTYVSPNKNIKTIEEDFNVPLISLSLISDTGRKNTANQLVYRVNRKVQESLDKKIFGYCLLNEFPEQNAVSFEEIRSTLGTYLCLSNEGLEIIIDDLCRDYKEFVYKDDAGIRQVQMKNKTEVFKYKILRDYYGAE